MTRSISLCAVVLALGCGRAETAAPVAVDAAEPAAARPAPAPVAHVMSPARRGESVAIPEGTLLVGSRPGTPDRRPRFEADLAPTRIAPFTIDRLPYPNDPAQPARRGATREEASGLCAAEGKRLCSELEWERACKGDDARDFPAGVARDVESCNRDPLACASPFGALMMGESAYEWTASDVTRGLGTADDRAVLRGAPASEPRAERRCGARHALAATDARSDVAFRCCGGDPSAVAYPDDPRTPLFRERDMDLPAMRAAIASMPEIARFAASFEPFAPVDVDRALGCAGRTRENTPFHFLASALDWTPVASDSIVILAGRASGSSLILALYGTSGGLVHGASFVLEGDPLPLAIGYDHTSPGTIHWSSCWGRSGDTGTISLREDGRVVIVQN